MLTLFHNIKKNELSKATLIVQKARIKQLNNKHHFE